MTVSFSEKMPHPSFVILRSLSLQFVKVFETVIFELNRRHDTDWMCEGLSNVVHDTVTLLCPQPVILLLIYWSGREEFLLLLVTFLAPSESGRQGGKSIQSGGSAIVDKNRIWKLRKICSISMVHLFGRCLIVDKIDFISIWSKIFFCVLILWMMERCFEGW